MDLSLSRYPCESRRSKSAPDQNIPLLMSGRHQKKPVSCFLESGKVFCNQKIWAAISICCSQKTHKDFASGHPVNYTPQVNAQHARMCCVHARPNPTPRSPDPGDRFSPNHTIRFHQIHRILPGIDISLLRIYWIIPGFHPSVRAGWQKQFSPNAFDLFLTTRLDHTNPIRNQRQ